MTSHRDAVGDELLELTLRSLRAGEWPWSFFCYPEERPREAYPSAFTLLAATGRQMAVAVRCPACTATSINLVSSAHLDVPFHNDREIGVVEHVFRDDLERTLEEFRAELDSSRFDARRLELD
jgi:antitoxin component of MazEF toxin-antitoxin module